MSLVSKVGRKTARTRLAMTLLYGLLTAGAITTLYPFLLMVTTGFKGPTDQDDNRLIPAYWTDNAELMEKYRTDKYSGNLSLMESSEVGAGAPAELVAEYEAFLMELPPHLWHAGFRTASNMATSRLNMRYQRWLRTRYDRDLDAMNAAYVELNAAFQTVAPPNENLDRRGWRPQLGPKWSDWEDFKAELPAEFRVPIRAEQLWQEFLRARFGNELAAVPPEVRGAAETFEQIRSAPDHPLWEEFREFRMPEAMQDGTVEELWAARVGADVPLPILSYETKFLETESGAIRREFTSRNYRYILDYILINGRALWNTVIFCGLAILTQLTINPLAAYALSRFPLPVTGQILLFLLATMAFPAEVALIPSFLLLKDLGLLNTFAALVLPTAASGFMIFLLKGFFDSLPREIFESGQIDGARETTMMLKLALPLSKPVLGYLALLAFMGAYGAFLYAFLVAQDRQMWTLMVFIYQLQQSAPKATIMAAVALAAIPSILVFLACQRVIMRGIVLPDER